MLTSIHVADVSSNGPAELSTMLANTQQQQQQSLLAYEELSALSPPTPPTYHQPLDTHSNNSRCPSEQNVHHPYTSSNGQSKNSMSSGHGNDPSELNHKHDDYAAFSVATAPRPLSPMPSQDREPTYIIDTLISQKHAQPALSCSSAAAPVTAVSALATSAGLCATTASMGVFPNVAGNMFTSGVFASCSSLASQLALAGALPGLTPTNRHLFPTLSVAESASSSASAALLRPANDTKRKPNLSYRSLISQAIFFSPQGKLTLASIYKSISDRHPYYRMDEHGWQNSIRHNLTLGECFVRVPREPGEGGKGSYWIIHQDYHKEIQLDGTMKRSRAKSTSNGSGRSRRRATLATTKLTSAPSTPAASTTPKSAAAAAAYSVGLVAGRSKRRRVVSAPGLSSGRKSPNFSAAQSGTHRRAPPMTAISMSAVSSATAAPSRYALPANAATAAPISYPAFTFMLPRHPTAVSGPMSLASMAGGVPVQRPGSHWESRTSMLHTPAASSSVAVPVGTGQGSSNTGSSWADAFVAASLPQGHPTPLTVPLTGNPSAGLISLPIWHEFAAVGNPPVNGTDRLDKHSGHLVCPTNNNSFTVPEVSAPYSTSMSGVVKFEDMIDMNQVEPDSADPYASSTVSQYGSPNLSLLKPTSWPSTATRSDNSTAASSLLSATINPEEDMQLLEEIRQLIEANDYENLLSHVSQGDLNLNASALVPSMPIKVESTVNHAV